MSADIQTVKKYISLCNKKKELEAKLEKTKKEIASMEEMIVEYFAENGIQSQNIDGHTAYFHSQIWAYLKGGQEGIDTLKKEGFKFLVQEQCNVQRLSAWVRELHKEATLEPREEDEDKSILELLPVPDPVKNVLNITERTSIKVRKS